MSVLTVQQGSTCAAPDELVEIAPCVAQFKIDDPHGEHIDMIAAMATATDRKSSQPPS